MNGKKKNGLNSRYWAMHLRDCVHPTLHWKCWICIIITTNTKTVKAKGSDYLMCTCFLALQQQWKWIYLWRTLNEVYCIAHRGKKRLIQVCIWFKYPSNARGKQESRERKICGKVRLNNKLTVQHICILKGLKRG